ncbi:heat shock 70 kDa protein IV-like [Lytechinus variegatus]|uniref:heat shock 70 kDa protein IV-like n=1 Tax=Lytechinus variegatus TaxID=7654 RepID=UPI001BB14467|nr:heat shock 70 kDa protein IV-like [Lytechinus variegatus]
MASGQGPVIGIHFGTSCSCVGVFQSGMVEIIPSNHGNRTTPNYVAFTDTEILIGETAKNQMPWNPKNTIFDIKRLIGRQVDDKDLQSDVKHWPFKFKEKAGKPMLEVEYLGQTKTLSPEEVSSVLLANLKETVEAFLHQNVSDAVITVPTYFSDSQRIATKNACTMAGLNVRRLLNEPTAAALAYGLEEVSDGQEMRVLVFHLDQSEVGASLLLIEDGIFEVVTSERDAHFGGEDFNRRIIDHLVNVFQKTNEQDLSTNHRAYRRLRNAAEKAVDRLSRTTHASIEIDSLHGGIDFCTSLSRVMVKELCSDLFKMCLQVVESILMKAKIDKKDIDRIILVGRSIPNILRTLQDFFGGKKIDSSINPEEVVAYGAALHAVNVSMIKDIVCFHGVPLSLGIKTADGVMKTIIARNTWVPTRASKRFSTYSDNQSEVSIQVFEGQRALAKDNNRLGQFVLSGIPPAPRGVPTIEVTFDIDANGILSTTAKDVLTGQSNGTTISNERRLSKEDIERVLKDDREPKDEDVVLQRDVSSQNLLKDDALNDRIIFETVAKL